MEQETEPGEPKEDYSTLERQDMEEFAKKLKVGPDNLQRDSFTTPMEQFLMGSTPNVGGAVWPNLTLAEVAGVGLEKVNKIRRDFNSSSEDGRFFYNSDPEVPFLVFELDDLSPEIIGSREPIITFHITKAKDIEMKEVPIPADTEERVMEKMREKPPILLDRLKHRHGLG